MWEKCASAKVLQQSKASAMMKRQEKSLTKMAILRRWNLNISARFWDPTTSSKSEDCWWEMRRIQRSWFDLSVVDPIVALVLQGACEKVLIAKEFPREVLLVGGDLICVALSFLESKVSKG